MISELLTKAKSLDSNLSSLFQAPVTSFLSDDKKESPDVKDVKKASSVVADDKKEATSTSDVQEEVTKKVQETEIPQEKSPKEQLSEKEKEKNSRTVFVGNVPTSVSEKSNLAAFKKIFKEHGTIQSIRFRSIAMAKPLPRKLAFIQKEFNSNRDAFNAYVVFADVASAQKAAEELNGATFMDHHLRVDMLVKPEKTKREQKDERKRCVFVGNLDFAVTDDALRRVFAACGEVDYVRVVRDKATGMGKGFGYVSFKDKASVPLALELNKHKMEKRELRVMRCKDEETLIKKKVKQPVVTTLSKETKFKAHAARRVQQRKVTKNRKASSKVSKRK